MKKLIILAILLMSTSVLAYSEIRCTGAGTDLDLRYWSGPSSNVRAELRVDENGTTRVDNFMMYTSSQRPFLLSFYGAGNTLEIDTWPDQTMRNLRSYSSTFRSFQTGFVRMRCTYWN